MSLRKMRKGRILAIATVGMLVIVVCMLWIFKAAPVSWAIWGEHNASDHIAMKGYDPVSYFDEAGPKLGNAAISTTWQGVEWRFVSEQNQKRFVADPGKYAPQFGGYCATAVSLGMTFDIDPEAWHRNDGKLYVFFDEAARDDFVSKIPDGIVATAEQQWNERK